VLTHYLLHEEPIIPTHHRLDRIVSLRSLGADEAQALQGIFEEICQRRSIIPDSSKAYSVASDLLDLYQERRNLREIRSLFALPPS
jgi:hypothetical protein